MALCKHRTSFWLLRTAPHRDARERGASRKGGGGDAALEPEREIVPPAREQPHRSGGRTIIAVHAKIWGGKHSNMHLRIRISSPVCLDANPQRSSVVLGWCKWKHLMPAITTYWSSDEDSANPARLLSQDLYNLAGQRTLCFECYKWGIKHFRGANTHNKLNSGIGWEKENLGIVAGDAVSFLYKRTKTVIESIVLCEWLKWNIIECHFYMYLDAELTNERTKWPMRALIVVSTSKTRMQSVASVDEWTIFWGYNSNWNFIESKIYFPVIRNWNWRTKKSPDRVQEKSWTGFER